MSRTDQSPGLRGRREEFPVESFSYLEAKLQEIRKVVMNRAAEIAESADLRPESYRVQKIHVDIALSEFLGDPDDAKETLGLTMVRAQDPT